MDSAKPPKPTGRLSIPDAWLLPVLQFRRTARCSLPSIDLPAHRSTILTTALQARCDWLRWMPVIWHSRWRLPTLRLVRRRDVRMVRHCRTRRRRQRLPCHRKLSNLRRCSSVPINRCNSRAPTMDKTNTRRITATSLLLEDRL